MFEITESPLGKYSNYLSMLRLANDVKHNANKLFGFIIDKDAKSLRTLYKARAHRLLELMKTDCERCLGTGSPMTIQSDLDLYYEECQECFRKNALV